MLIVKYTIYIYMYWSKCGQSRGFILGFISGSTSISGEHGGIKKKENKEKKKKEDNTYKLNKAMALPLA